MAKQEVTNERDLTFNNMHRTFDDKCYSTDLDFIEADGKGNILALIEIKSKGNLSDFQRNVFLNIANILKVPLYVINHDENYIDFYVTPVNKFARKELSEITYYDRDGIKYFIEHVVHKIC